MASDEKGLFEEGRNCWKQSHARRGAYLVDTAEYYAELHRVFNQAEQTIFILGWDIDSSVVLLRDASGAPACPPFARLLKELVERRPELQIYILSWDFFPIYAAERELFTEIKLAFGTHPNIKLVFDDQHPITASHHHKIVVVDDRLAFCGGIDITANRWDTPEHRPNDPRRANPRGELYTPFHDVQMMVEGPAARDLAEIARERWHRATQTHLPPPPDITPPGRDFAVTRVDFTDACVGIARTYPQFKDYPEVREVECLFLNLMASARRQIYIETQYFTAEALVATLIEILTGDSPPEIVLVLPCFPGGWLEKQTMGNLQNEMLRRLHDADRHHRLSVRYPTVPGVDPKTYTLHSKLMIIDDVYACIGTANLNNRSMGMDTECNLVVDGSADPAVRDSIRVLEARLLAEHLGLRTGDVESRLMAGDTATAILAKNSVNQRTLKPFKLEEPTQIGRLLQETDLLDMKKPWVVERAFDKIAFRVSDYKGRRRIFLSGALLLALVALPLIWKFTPLSEYLKIENLKAVLQNLRGARFAPLLVIGAYLIAGLLFCPLNLLILATATIFPAFEAFLYCLTGSLANAALTFGIGRLLGKNHVAGLFPKSFQVFSEKLRRNTALSVAMIRLLPIAPFSAVNMFAGAANLRFWPFLAGTLLGLLPGITLLVIFQRNLLEMIFEPSLTTALFLACMLGAMIALAYLLKKRLSTTHDPT